MERFLTRRDTDVGVGEFDSVKWAIETHLGRNPDAFPYHYANSAILFGNEDCPDRIDFYESESPTITDTPVFTWPAPTPRYIGQE